MIYIVVFNDHRTRHFILKILVPDCFYSVIPGSVAKRAKHIFSIKIELYSFIKITGTCMWEAKHTCIMFYKIMLLEKKIRLRFHSKNFWMRGSHTSADRHRFIFIVGHDCRNSGRWWCYGFVPTHYRVISPCLYYLNLIEYLPLSSSNFYELYKITSSTKSWCLPLQVEGSMGYAHWVCTLLKDKAKHSTEMYRYAIHQMAAIPAASDALARYLGKNRL